MVGQPGVYCQSARNWQPALDVSSSPGVTSASGWIQELRGARDRMKTGAKWAHWHSPF
jgi:hypothetical protein